MTAAVTAAQQAVGSPGAASRGSQIARSMFYDLRALPRDMRRDIMTGLNGVDYAALLDVSAHEGGTPFALWQDDPVGFVEVVLGDSTWSKQREILESLVDNEQTAVPSAFGTGKTFISGSAALWRMCVFPWGSSLTVTTATRFRQVKRQLWPHVKRKTDKVGLPIEVDTTQAHGRNEYGTRVQLGYGFSAPPWDEAAVQGIHEEHLFIIVDEGGGISRTVGKALRGLQTGDDTRLLVIGNPPTDDENSWFEDFCKDEETKTIPISAYDAPQQTGEATRRCTSCHHSTAPHGVGRHLVDSKWIRNAIKDHGEDSPFVKAKVYAKFPRGGPARTIPMDWIDLCTESPEPLAEDGYVLLSDLIDGETDVMVKPGAWIRLGVDVAADGGDEFVISRAVGDVLTVQHTSAGAVNANSVDVAGRVLQEIRRAEQVRAALKTEAKIRVKVDTIGVGWGVVGTLTAWGDEGIHDAEIVAVNVAEDTYRDDDKATFRPRRKRDEMWLAGRDLMQPRSTTGRGLLRLRVDDKTAAQLGAPTYSTDSGGRTVVESKDKMKARGVKSPDRAESLLLAVYEPLLKASKGTFRVIV